MFSREPPWSWKSSSSIPPCQGPREKFYQGVQRPIPAPLAPGVLVGTCIACLYSNENIDETGTMLRFIYRSVVILATSFYTSDFELDYRKTYHAYFHPPWPHYLPGHGTTHILATLSYALFIVILIFRQTGGPYRERVHIKFDDPGWAQRVVIRTAPNYSYGSHLYKVHLCTTAMNTPAYLLNAHACLQQWEQAVNLIPYSIISCGS